MLEVAAKNNVIATKEVLMIFLLFLIELFLDNAYSLAFRHLLPCLYRMGLYYLNRFTGLFLMLVGDDGEVPSFPNSYVSIQIHWLSL